MTVLHVRYLYTTDIINRDTHEEVCIKMAACMIIKNAAHFLITNFQMRFKNELCILNMYALMHYSYRRYNQHEQRKLSLIKNK